MPLVPEPMPHPAGAAECPVNTGRLRSPRPFKRFADASRPGPLVAVEDSRIEVPVAASYRERADHFYRQYGPMVYRRCLRLLRDPDAAKDATQEVFIRLLRDMEKLESRETALPWAYRVATNHCLNMRRDSMRKREATLDPELQVQSEQVSADYPDVHLAHAVLSRFDAQTQAVAVGVFVDGMEHEEVAEALGISRRTVSRKLDRFLQNARKFLARSTP
jgi:RNA polymerase sigma-70 factor, ECF subfamily